MVGLVKKHKIQQLNPISICHARDTHYTIEAIANPDEILSMAKNGYYIQIVEEVGIDNSHKQKPSPPHPTTTDLSSATVEDHITSYNQ